MAPKRRAAATSNDAVLNTGADSDVEAPAPDLDAERRERMARNAAALAAFGVANAANNLRQAVAASKAPARPAPAKATGVGKPRVRPPPQPLRRSHRIAGAPAPKLVELDDDGNPVVDDDDGSGEGRGLLDLMGREALALAAAQAEGLDAQQRAVVVEARRTGKSRGEVNQSLGISCHFCRQKTMCCEVNCPRCSQRDASKDCIGKTSCASCQSGNGIFCRACLLTRYGQDLDQVRSDPTWLCPHCYEEKHGDWKVHGWFCNSSICMRDRGQLPTGIAIHRARAMGYASVAHMLQATVIRMAKGKEDAKKETNEEANMETQENRDGERGDTATAEPVANGDGTGKGQVLRQMRSKRTRTREMADSGQGSQRQQADPKALEGAAPPAAAAAAAAVEL